MASSNKMFEMRFFALICFKVKYMKKEAIRKHSPISLNMFDHFLKINIRRNSYKNKGFIQHVINILLLVNKTITRFLQKSLYNKRQQPKNQLIKAQIQCNIYQKTTKQNTRCFL